MPLLPPTAWRFRRPLRSAEESIVASIVLALHRASENIVGKSTMAGWLSVCPPESASAVTSSAIGIVVAHSGLLWGDLTGQRPARAGTEPAAGP